MPAVITVAVLAGLLLFVGGYQLGKYLARVGDCGANTACVKAAGRGR